MAMTLLLATFLLNEIRNIHGVFSCSVLMCICSLVAQMIAFVWMVERYLLELAICLMAIIQFRNPAFQLFIL